MIRTRRPFAAAACALSLSLSAAAQQPAPPSKTKPAASTTRGAADPLAANRRATAVTLVNTLADEARSFRDQALRARVQMQAADALWETEQERARTLFRRAWDAAEQADQESRKQRESELRAPGTGGAGGGGGGGGQSLSVEQVRGAAAGRPGALAAMLNRPNLRSEVLRLAAKRDRALGEEFLAKLDEQRKQDERDINAESVASGAGAGAGGTAAGGTEAPPMPSSINAHDTPADDARRLELAIGFLRDNDTERALQFAAPALDKVNTTVAEFLVSLREKSPDQADQMFGALLARAAADPMTDPNAVLILSSYVLTPHMYMNVEQRGGLSTSQRQRDTTPPANMAAAVRAGFARFAAQELMRPLPPADQPESRAARGAAYFVIGRLLPFFEQTLPSVVAPLRTQMSAVMPDLPPDMRQSFERNMTRGLVPESQRSDGMQEALDAAERATTQEARDSAYLQAALISSRKGDPKARDYASKIENANLREQAYAYVDFTAVNQAIQKKDGMEVLRLAQGGALTDTQRTWALTEAARLLKDDRARANEALEAASLSARKIDAADPDRPRSLVAVATEFFAVDRGRAWELMQEVVKSANAASEFTGTDAGMAVRVEAPNMRSTVNFPAPSFDLTGIFRSLGKDDMNRAVALAQTFTGESPRAVATIAIARAVLEEKPPARASR
ncbi:MAG TPA: hypothetical protein VM864_03515 [Pyrinomonadaceae bacterium]|jgi:hypothetical protein|nr:hypothetical protein [Pyrinomonadaceae bacterium]